MLKLRLFIPLVLLAINFSARAVPPGDPPRDCSLNLATIDPAEYAAHFAESELSLERLREANQVVHRAFLNLGIFRNPALIHNPRLAATAPTLLTLFSGAVSNRISGLDEISDRQAGHFKSELGKIGFTDFGTDDFLKSVRQCAENPQVYRAYSMGHFMLQNMPSLEQVFLGIHELVPNFMDVRWPALHFLPGVAIGPRQMELVRSAIQYSLTRYGDHVLEIGYNTPSTLTALAHFLRPGKLVGLDSLPVPPNANRVFGARNIEFVQGRFPDEGSAMERVRAAGPYTIIMALDTLKMDPRVLHTSQPGIVHALALKELLAPGGVAIILNDFDGEPYFSQAEAMQAGLKIVRWGTKRPLPPNLRRLVPYSPHEINPGLMNLTVLRNGPVREDRLGTWYVGM